MVYHIARTKRYEKEILIDMDSDLDLRQPFFHQGNSTGCLLIHGFTGTPSEMRPLGTYLNQQGYTVSGIQLPGHGTKPEDLMRVKWEAWYQEAVAGYLKLKNK